jgi:hypothetical protein
MTESAMNNVKILIEPPCPTITCKEAVVKCLKNKRIMTINELTTEVNNLA